MLREHLDKLHVIAAALIEKETLEASELEQLMQEGKITEKPVEEEPSDVTMGPEDTVPVPDAEPGPKVVYNLPETSGGNA